VRGVGPGSVEQRIALAALVDDRQDTLATSTAMRLVAMEAVGQPVNLAVLEDDHGREDGRAIGVDERLVVLHHRRLVEPLAWLCAAVESDVGQRQIDRRGCALGGLLDLLVSHAIPGRLDHRGPPDLCSLRQLRLAPAHVFFLRFAGASCWGAAVWSCAFLPRFGFCPGAGNTSSPR
jgi:hypothetical protein